MLALGRATRPRGLGSKRPFLSWCQQQFPAELRWSCGWKAGKKWRGSRRGGAPLQLRGRSPALNSQSLLSSGVAPTSTHTHTSLLTPRQAHAPPPPNLHTHVRVHPHAPAHTRWGDFGTSDLVFLGLWPPPVTSPSTSYFHR